MAHQYEPLSALDSADDVIRHLLRCGIEMERNISHVQALPGGVSARTYLVHRATGSDWVVKQALPMLRVATDWPSDPGRIHREAAALRWLNRVLGAGATVRAVHEDSQAHILVMEAVAQPHANWRTLLLRGDIQLQHLRNFASILASIHREGAKALDSLTEPFSDRTYFDSLRLDPFYRYSMITAPEASEFLLTLVSDTLGRQLTFVHGDYSPKNILIHDNTMILVDHEVAHLGDPAFDLGFSLAHFLGKAHFLPAARARFREAAIEYWDLYQDLTEGLWDREFRALVAAHTLACSLARACGRSPLDYLSPQQRARQRQVVASMMVNGRYGDVREVIIDFVKELES